MQTLFVVVMNDPRAQTVGSMSYVSHRCINRMCVLFASPTRDIGPLHQGLIYPFAYRSESDDAAALPVFPLVNLYTSEVVPDATNPYGYRTTSPTGAEGAALELALYETKQSAVSRLERLGLYWDDVDATATADTPSADKISR